MRPTSTTLSNISVTNAVCIRERVEIEVEIKLGEAYSNDTVSNSRWNRCLSRYISNLIVFDWI